MNLERSGILFVAGTFDDTGGKRSKVMDELFLGIMEHLRGRLVDKVLRINGGDLDQLKCVLESAKSPSYKFVFWFPNLDNSHEKMVRNIKKNSPDTMLVTSKRNFDEYDIKDVVAHGLKNKSNLVVEINKHLYTNATAYLARVIDPLGNIFCKSTYEFYQVGQILASRIETLSNFNRENSHSAGSAKKVPNESCFFNIVKKHAAIFDDLLPRPAFPERFLGNASFRCRKGFPSFRRGKLIFVSRRNVDKTFIDSDGFVAVDADAVFPVMYYGDHKPSIDTPIHIHLYKELPHINYMIHGHVYVKDAPMTENNVLCVAIEESNEVMSLLNRECSGLETNKFAINLKGHGSLVGWEDSNQTISIIEYESRQFPELIETPV